MKKNARSRRSKRQRNGRAARIGNGTTTPQFPRESPASEALHPATPSELPHGTGRGDQVKQPPRKHFLRWFLSLIVTCVSIFFANGTVRPILSIEPASIEKDFLPTNWQFDIKNQGWLFEANRVRIYYSNPKNGLQFTDKMGFEYSVGENFISDEIAGAIGPSQSITESLNSVFDLNGGTASERPAMQIGEGGATIKQAIVRIDLRYRWLFGVIPDGSTHTFRLHRTPDGFHRWNKISASQVALPNGGVLPFKLPFPD